MSARFQEVPELKKEFTKSFNAYIKQSSKIEWEKVPGVTKPTSRQLIWKDLWQADMGYVLREYFFKDDQDGTKYGYLPKMAMASKGMMCAAMAASFCERVNSCAGEVVDERNSLLSVDEIDKVTVLRMNKEFMEFMRREYPEVATLKTSHGKYGTVVTMAHAEEDKVDGQGIEAQPNDVDMGWAFTFTFTFFLILLELSTFTFTNKALCKGFTFTHLIYRPLKRRDAIVITSPQAFLTAQLCF